MCENCSSPKKSITLCLKAISSANANINSIALCNLTDESDTVDIRDFEKISQFSDAIFFNVHQILKCISHIEEIPPDD